MIVLSMNVRVVGSSIKQLAVRNLVTKNKVDLVCLQETKLQDVDVNCCRRISGDASFGWEFSPAVNRGGGLLCIWRYDFWTVSSCSKGQGIICISGKRLGMILNLFSL